MASVAARLIAPGVAPFLMRNVRASTWEPPVLDLSDLAWATPFDVAAIAALWTRMALAEKEAAVILPTDPTVRAYLVDMGLADVVPGDWGPGGGCAVDPPWLRLTRVKSSAAWDELQNDLMRVASAALQDPTLTLNTMEILGELVDNAATHGVSEVGTFVCAQRYTGTTSGLQPGVWLGIADAGVGVPDHLRRNPKYAGISKDSDLIVLARRQWVTGTAEARGWGLVDVFDRATESGPSQVLVRSLGGEGEFRLRPNKRVYARTRSIEPPVPGTWIHLRVEGP